MNYQDENSILEALRNSKFNEEDRRFWLPRIQAAPMETRASIVEFLRTVPGGAEWLRAIQEEKEQALFTGDREAWVRVLDDEAAILPS